MPKEKTHELLIKKAEQIRAASDIVTEKTQDWQVIRQFMNARHSEIILTPKQQEKMNRYKFIYDQLSSGRYTKSDVINQLMNKSLFGISMAQAYEDIRCSAELFSSVLHVSRQFELVNEIEIAKKARAKCEAICDFKSAAAYSKVIKDLIGMLPDEEIHPGEDFEGHEVTAVFDPSLLGAPPVNMKEVLSMLNTRHKASINIDMFEELEYSDVKNEKETTL